MSQGKRKRKGKGRSRRVATPAPAPEVSEEVIATPVAPESRAEARRARRDARADLESTQTALPLERERTLGRLIGGLALASTALIFVAVAFATKASSDGPRQVSLFSGGGGEEVSDAEQLQDYAHHTHDQLISAMLQVGGLLVAIIVGLYLYWLVRNRTTSIRPYVKWLAFVGPVLFAVAVVLVHLAMREVSDAFVELPLKGQTSDRADDLKADSSLLLIAGIADFVGRVAFAAWLGLISREAMNVELLTRFLGIFGIGAAFAVVLGVLDVQIGLAMYVGWVASVGILALGRWPGGRPEGWQYRVDPSVAR